LNTTPAITIQEEDMSQQSQNRGAAEENAGVPETPEEHDGPVSPASLPGDHESSRVRGAAEEAADAPRTE
jgi:hypothetical protein